MKNEHDISEIIRLAAMAGEREFVITFYQEQILNVLAKLVEGKTLFQIHDALKR